MERKMFSDLNRILSYDRMTYGERKMFLEISTNIVKNVVIHLIRVNEPVHGHERVIPKNISDIKTWLDNIEQVTVKNGKRYLRVLRELSPSDWEDILSKLISKHEYPVNFKLYSKYYADVFYDSFAVLDILRGTKYKSKGKSFLMGSDLIYQVIEDQFKELGDINKYITEVPSTELGLVKPRRSFN